MIPLFCHLKVKPSGKNGVNLWIPLFLLWILLLPLGVLLFAVWLVLHALSHLHYGIALGAAAVATAGKIFWNLRDLQIQAKTEKEEIHLYFI
jgi:uncharacterized RDD family membrane protein YckC